MDAPQRFADWLANNRHVDRRYGHTYLYHSRSDSHSVALCKFILEDLVAASAVLRAQALTGLVAYGINVPFVAPSGKAKNLDLALGRPAEPIPSTTLLLEQPIVRVPSLSDLYFGCEAKSVMTEHGKSQPRVYDELSSSHEIVHQGRPEAIAAGVAVVNIAATFVSPLRQTSRDELHISKHKQPHVTGRMVQHLRGLPIREEIGQVGFDAFCTIVVESDNRTTAILWTEPPAPQPGDRDHYATFVERFVRFYEERFSSAPVP